MKSFFLWLITIFSFYACQNIDNHNNSNNTNSILKYSNIIELKSFENEIEIGDEQHSIKILKSELPLKKIMVVPTSAIAYLDILGEIGLITGVSQPEFIFNSKISSKIKSKEIENIGAFDELYLEKIIAHKPDILISTSSPTLAKFHQQLIGEGIRIIYFDEYNELEPLAKAEYLKIIGVLVGQEKLATETFHEIERNYNELKNLAQKSTIRPKILLNHIYGDIWYMPSGDSFQAKLLEDANADYLWQDSDGSGVINLNFEQVFQRGSKADYWINVGDFPNLKSLEASYPHYNWFRAFERSEVYNLYNRTTATGGNDYFEMGTARPDWILKDLIKIFHPSLLPDHRLYFYKKLK